MYQKAPERKRVRRYSPALLDVDDGERSAA
jgi:hypothetical protein